LNNNIVEEKIMGSVELYCGEQGRTAVNSSKASFEEYCSFAEYVQL
jgi:hypothetical protein